MDRSPKPESECRHQRNNEVVYIKIDCFLVIAHLDCSVFQLEIAVQVHPECDCRDNSEGTKQCSKKHCKSV